MEDDFINELKEFYNSDRDFTSLVEWQKCRDVKLFFYNENSQASA